MIGQLARKIFGSANDRYVKRQYKIVNQINAFEPSISALSDEELKNKTVEFRKRIADGETLDELLPEAFAVVREAAKRTLGQRHYDVQLIGGIVLHHGQIAEMKTGEGKTLVATLAAYLNALPGKGVHIVTVNDYLARRDAEWMGQVYRFLGLTVDYIIHEKTDEERRAAYNSDIIYATNNELGFDYLRDNMKFSLADMVQRPFNYAIVDEVDSILIDEARTPLIISGAAEDSSEKYILVNKIIPHLTEADYEKDEKARTVTLTECGMTHVEALLKEVGLIKEGGLYDVGNVSLVHHVNQALRAHKMHIRDVDYIVKNDKVVIIDEFTGRMMEGRRYSDGLHQAIEAKEGVSIQSENQTLASITFQNYFRLYPKLAGMTGTAMTEEAEFGDIYNLTCVEIPTNRPVQRQDLHDEIYRTEKEKYDAIINTILDCHRRGQPVLVGTTSIEKSELVADLLRSKSNVKFEVLNARHHEREAAIVAQAGVPAAITIATNMAGRGTDIQLGGNVDMRLKEMLKGDETEEQITALREKIKTQVEEDKQKVLEAGGLYILGTERHESRRIDNQLRGRAGRQGDPGSSVFFVSLEDKLMRLFASERISRVMDKLGFEDGEMIEHKMISNAIERAQKKVEENHFGVRKRLLEYDDVMNKQRTVVYEKRRHALMGERIGMDISNMIWDRCVNIIENNDYQGCKEGFIEVMAMEVPFTEDEMNSMKREDLCEKAFQAAMERFKQKTDMLAAVAQPVIKQVYEAQGHMYENIMVPVTDGRRIYQISTPLKEAYETESRSIVKAFEKAIMLHTIDEAWKENLRELDELKHSVQNASYEQKDPLLIFKLESVKLFDAMVDKINNQTVSVLMRGQIPVQQPEQVREAEPELAPRQERYVESREDLTDPNQEAAARQDTREPQKQQPVVAEKLPGRNDPCPCGSGKKFKNCHGRGL